MKVAGAAPFSFGYDSHAFLTSVAGLNLTIDPATGLYSGNSIGAVTSGFDYDAVGDFVGVDYQSGGSTLFSSQATDRDALGRTTTRTETVDGATATYEYAFDAVGRLTTVEKNNVVVESYTYDANGNRLTATAPGLSGSATYNGRDQLLTGPGGAAYTYDADGQLTTRTGPGAATYSWDRFGFLKGANLSGGPAVTYHQDGANQRVGRTVDGVKSTATSTTRRDASWGGSTGAAPWWPGSPTPPARRPR